MGGRKHGVEIECKDFRTLRFFCNRGDGSKRQILDFLERCLFPNRDKMFAFVFREPRWQETARNGWAIFDHAAELRRMGVGQQGSAWRITRMNIDYKYAPTYPAVVAVPNSFTDELLMFVSCVKAWSMNSELTFLPRLIVVLCSSTARRAVFLH